MSDPMVPYVVRKVDGADVKFGKLSPRNRAEILKKLKDERRPRFIEALEKGGVTGEKYVNEVDAFDALPYTVDDLVRYLNTPEGQDAVITIAARKTNGDKADEILDKLSLDNQDTTDLTFELAGIKVMFIQRGAESRKEDERSEEQPRPSEPAASNP